MGPMNYVEPPDIPEGMTIEDWRRKHAARRDRHQWWSRKPSPPRSGRRIERWWARSR